MNCNTQMIDIGIALCHFALTAKENNIKYQSVKSDPLLKTEPGIEYILTDRLAEP